MTEIYGTMMTEGQKAERAKQLFYYVKSGFECAGQLMVRDIECARIVFGCDIKEESKTKLYLSTLVEHGVHGFIGKGHVIPAFQMGGDIWEKLLERVSQVTIATFGGCVIIEKKDIHKSSSTSFHIVLVYRMSMTKYLIIDGRSDLLYETIEKDVHF